MDISDDVLNSAKATNTIADAGFTTIPNSPNTSFAENLTHTESQNSSTSFQNSEDNAVSNLMIINAVITVFIVIVGLLGNSVTIIVMRKEPFRSNSYGIHLTALAVTDMLCVVMLTLIKDSTIYFLDRDILAQSEIICKIFCYAIISVRICASSNVVYICVERFIAVWFPFKAKDLLTKRSAIIISGCIFVAASIVGIFSSLTSVVKFGKCLPYDDFIGAIPITFTIGAILIITAPTIILLLLTSLTIFKLIRVQLLRRRLTNNSDRATEQLTYMTGMLIGTVIAYIVLVSCPLGARVVLAHTGITLVELQTRGLREHIAILEQINCASNFIIYGLLCSEFRNQFVEIFRGAFRMRTETSM